jgi:hypothetical protein
MLEPKLLLESQAQASQKVELPKSTKGIRKNNRYDLPVRGLIV